MADQPKKPLFSSFGYNAAPQVTSNYAPSLPTSFEQHLKERHQSFYGSVFNALDDYLRKGHGYALPASAIRTDFMIDKEGAFCISFIPAPYSDNLQDRPQQAVQDFFKEIFDVAQLHEMEGFSYGQGSNPAGDQMEYILKFDNKYEVMQLVEHLLKPYDFGEGFFPDFRDVSENSKKSVPFSLFPQYSLRHIRAMFMMTQGRSSEVSGMDMNH